MPRLRSKILLNSDKNDSSIETTPNENKRKTRKQSESGDLFSISKLKNDEQMLTDESIEFVSLISPDLKTTESEEEIQMINVLKHNKITISDTEGSEKENEIQNYKKRNNRKSIQNISNFSNFDTKSNRRQLRSRKSISNVDTIDCNTAKKELSKNNKNNLNSSDSDGEKNENFNNSHKTRKERKSFINQEEDVILTVSDHSETINSNIENVNTENDSKSDKQRNESGKTVIGNKRKNNIKGVRKSTKNLDTKEVEDLMDSNSGIEVNKMGPKKDKKFTRNHKNSFETVQITDDEIVNSDSNEIVSKLKRSTRNNDEVEISTHKDLKREIEFEGKLNGSKSKVARRSTRAQENSVAAVEDLLTDNEDIKLKFNKSEMNRESTRASENSSEATTNLTTDNENPMSENQDIVVKSCQSKLKVNRRSARVYENSFYAGNHAGSANEKSKTENRDNDIKIDEKSFKKNRRSLRSNENSFVKDKDLISDSESGDMEIVEKNLNRSKKDRRSTCIHEKSFEIVKDLIIHKDGKLENHGIYLEVNGNISRKDKRSIRSSEEISFEAVKNLTVDTEVLKLEDQDVKINQSRVRTDRRSTRIHEASFEAVKDLIIDNKDATFSPKSPKFDYQDTFTSNVHTRTMRKSKYETSTPAKSLISKPVTKKTNLNITPYNISLIDLTNFTPRSIIKKPARSIQNSTNKSQVTLRKKRSISESDLTNTRKSRVTFHPNTSVFHMDSLDSTLDDSEISINVHSTSLIKESTSKKSIDFVSINPLNDTYDMDALENQSTDAIESANLSIKSNTPEIDGVQKLNETFTPEEDKSKVREIGKRIKVHEKQPLVTDSAAKRKFYKKTPKRLLNSSVGGSLKKNSNQEQTPIKIGTNNFQRNIKAAIDNNQVKINKSNVLNSLKKTPSTSSKNQPTPKRGTSTKKMPDFTSIHKRNFEKMESLVENVKKRADRAKKLFAFIPDSGNKNISNNNHNKPTRLPVPSNRLVSATTTVKTPSKENSLCKANLKNTPGKANIKNTPGKLNKKNTPGQTNLPKPLSRFGFGLQNAKDKKETLKEELKKKQPILGDLGTLRQKERQYVKGVRSNRRFDLLMKSRDCK